MDDKNKLSKVFNDPNNLPASDRTSDSYIKENPGLKEDKDLLNENPTEEKEAIEKTSDDRLDAAE